MEYRRSNESGLDFGPRKGSHPSPSAPWIPFLINDSPRHHTQNISVALNATPESFTRPPVPSTSLAHNPLSYHITWGDGSTLEWKLHLVDPAFVMSGLVSIAVEMTAVGPQPQDRQVILVLPQAEFGLDG